MIIPSGDVDQLYRHVKTLLLHAGQQKTLGSAAYKTITAGLDGIPGLVDTNVAAKEHDIAQPYTFHNWGKVPAENGQIIDFIFVNDKVDVAKFKINPVKHTNGRFASDHVSIVATLSLK